MTGCYACDLSSGKEKLLGGLLHETRHWRVEHCQGPLGRGTMIVKPKRHCLRVSELTAEESGELGPLLQATSAVVAEVMRPDQTYVCLWSHAGWEPGHIHFVVQPAWNAQKERHAYPGPTLQHDMFETNEPLDENEVERVCDEARRRFRAQRGGGR